MHLLFYKKITRQDTTWFLSQGVLSPRPCFRGKMV